MTNGGQGGGGVALGATLAAIDELAVDVCGQCDRPLHPGGPSIDFCDAACQEAWTRHRNEVQELIGYQEPTDLSAHVGNQREMESPETTPRYGEWPREYPVEVSVTRDEVTFLDGFGRAIHRRWDATAPAAPTVEFRVCSGDFAADVTEVRTRFGGQVARLEVPNGAIAEGLDLSALPPLVEQRVAAGHDLNNALRVAFACLVDEHYANYRRRWLVGLDQHGQLTPVAEHHRGQPGAPDLDFDPGRVGAALRATFGR